MKDNDKAVCVVRKGLESQPVMVFVGAMLAPYMEGGKPLTGQVAHTLFASLLGGDVIIASKRKYVEVALSGMALAPTFYNRLIGMLSPCEGYLPENWTAEESTSNYESIYDATSGIAIFIYLDEDWNLCYCDSRY